MMSPLLGMNGMNGMDSMQMAAAAAAAAAAQTYSMGYSSVMNSPDFGLSANAQTVRQARSPIWGRISWITS